MHESINISCLQVVYRVSMLFSSIPHLYGATASASLVRTSPWPNASGYPTQGLLIERSPLHAYYSTLVLVFRDEILIRVDSVRLFVEEL